MNDDEAYREGYDAFWAGCDPDDNPHPPPTAEHVSWTEGWLQGRAEDGLKEADW